MGNDAIEIDVNDMKDVEEVEQQEPTSPEPSTEENKAPEAVPGFDDETEPEKETEGDKAEESDKDEPTEQADETDKDEKPRAKNEAQNRIRTLANENRQLRQQVEQLNSQVYSPATEQDLVEQGMPETEAKVESLRQQMEVERFNRTVTELNSTLNSEAQEVLRDFPLFDPESPEFKPELAQRANAIYQQSAGIQTDPNTGLVIQANVLPYDFYKSFAEAYEAGATTGKVNGQKATEQMLASVDVPSSTPPKEPKKDSFLSGFDSV